MSEVCQILRPLRSCLLAALMTVIMFPEQGTALAAGPQQTLPFLGQTGLIWTQANDDTQAKAPYPSTTPAGNQNATEEEVPFADLNEALSAARSRLAELTEAAEIAKVAGSLQKELEAAKVENKQLKAVLNQVQSEKQQVTRQLETLGKAMSEATDEAGRLNQELIATRSEDQDLRAKLKHAEALTREQEDQFEQTRAQLTDRVNALTLTGNEAAGEISRLTDELEAANQQAANAEKKNAEVASTLNQHRQLVNDSENEAARLAKDLDSTITELGRAQSDLKSTHEDFDETKATLIAANQETSILREQLIAKRDEADKLKSRLDDAAAEIERITAINTGLQDQVGILKTAAGEAADAARLNLTAVEDRINEINAAIASVKSDGSWADDAPGAPNDPRDGSPVKDDAAAVQGRTQDTAANNYWVPRPSPARSSARQQLIAAAATDVVGESASANPLATRVGQQVPNTGPSASLPPVELAALVVDLPSGQQDQALSLLADMNAVREEQGLKMTVPGALLFAVDSDKIEPSAHDELSRVASLLDLYDERNVLIVGHTDAVGDAAYNQQLSERRAALVKAFFVEKFDISPQRLLIEGLGEQNPITSNATFEGRDINRRVDVVILN
ncbi:MAG: OmpA family protein [Geminicoccaceae bacterium]